MLKSQTLPISEIKRTNITKLRAVIVKYIEGTLEYFGYNPESATTNNQIRMLVDDICDKYSYLSIEDVGMCFKRARQNPDIYGKFFGRFDASVVMGWFSKYDKERDNVLHSLPSQQKYKPTGNEVSREEYLDMLLAMAAGGDPFACRSYQIAIDMDNERRKIAGQSAVYQYNRKHRYDEKPTKWRR